MSIDKALRSQIEKIRMGFNGAFGPMPEPGQWVFIVGCYGSGTTLLNNMLATHPMIASLPREGQFLTDQLPTPRSLGLARLWALQPERFYLDENSPDGGRVARIKRQWGTRFNHLDRPVLVEKSVPNMARIRWLNRHFSPAKFIAIVRSPYVVAESIRRKKSHALADCARQWAKSNEIMLRDLELVADKRVISYEKLTEHPNETWQDILDFIGLDNDQQTDMSTLEWNIHGNNSRITNMNARYLDSLSEPDLLTIEEHSEPLLSRLGYRINR